MVEVIRLKPGESGLDLTKARQRIIGMHNKACVYDGEEFKSLLALANRLGVSKSTVTRAIKKGIYRGKEIGLL